MRNNLQDTGAIGISRLSFESMLDSERCSAALVLANILAKPQRTRDG